MPAGPREKMSQKRLQLLQQQQNLQHPSSECNEKWETRVKRLGQTHRETETGQQDILPISQMGKLVTELPVLPNNL